MSADHTITRRVITAVQLRESDLYEIIALPTESWDIMAGGSLEAFKVTSAGIRITVKSRADGTRSSYTLAADDEVVVYGGARAEQDAAELPPVIANVLAASLTQAGIEQWFHAANRLLQGHSPQAAMQAGQYQQVMAAAISFEEGTYA